MATQGLRPPPLLPLLLLGGAWLLLHGPALAWLGRVALAGGSYGANLVLLLGLGAVAAWRLRCARAPAAHGAPSPADTIAGLRTRLLPRAEPLPLLVLLGASLLGAAAARLVQIHVLSALLMGLSIYGLAGLLLPPALFRRGLPAALLLCALLPFGAHGSTLLGMGARVLCARAVHELLSGLGVAAASAETILVLEGGVAHVDVPCSGLRSLWAGMVVFLAASWLGRHRPGGRWLLVGAGGAVLLLWANTLRVLCLVLLGLVLGRRDLAEIAHVPLGALGFLGSCALTLLLLRTFVPRTQGRAPAPAPPLTPLAAGLLSLLLLTPVPLRLWLPPRPAAASSAPIVLPSAGSSAGPAALSFHPAPLTGAESALFGRFGAGADKWRFGAVGLRGSLLLVSATALRAQHPPELCLAAAGLRLERMETRASAVPGLAVRHLSLLDGAGRRRSALYWFQSRARTTPDFWTRLGRGLLAGERRWVMVSLLLDDGRPPDGPELAPLLQLVRGAVQRSLEGES